MDDEKLRDIFHLWTGETNNIEYFLTIDKRFINAISQNQRSNLPCKPIAPDDLLSELNVLERDLLPFETNQNYDFFGNKLIV